MEQRTELLLDDLEDFLLVELLGKTLDSGQSLSTIAFYLLGQHSYLCGVGHRGAVPPKISPQEHLGRRWGLTLNTNVYVILRLLCLSRILVGFGEGICVGNKR